VAVAALGAVISGLAAGPTLGDERANGWLRQLRTTPLRPSTAVAAKIAVAMSFALPAIALVAAAGGLVGDNEGLALGGAQWLKLVGLMWLATTPITAIGALIGLTFGGEAAHGATTLAFVVLWLAGGIFTPPSQLPDALAAISRTLPSWGVVRVGESVAAGRSLSAAALVVLAAWTVGAGGLAALAWRRVLAR
jgi:ABC-2 type transport system permease protein